MKGSCIADEPDICIISDRGSALSVGLATEYPQAYKVACSRHVGNNAKHHASYKVAQVDSFVSLLAKAFTKDKYLDIREKFIASGLDEDKVIRILGYMENPSQVQRKWAVYFDLDEDPRPPRRYGITTNNAAESYNSALLPMRSRPICAAFYFAIEHCHERYMEMQRNLISSIARRYPGMEADQVAKEICPGKYSEYLDKQFNRIRNLSYSVVGEDSFRAVFKIQRHSDDHLLITRKAVFDKEDNMFYCSCESMWHMGIPCSHILFLMQSERLPGSHVRKVVVQGCIGSYLDLRSCSWFFVC